MIVGYVNFQLIGYAPQVFPRDNADPLVVKKFENALDAFRVLSLAVELIRVSHESVEVHFLIVEVVHHILEKLCAAGVLLVQAHSHKDVK